MCGVYQTKRPVSFCLAPSRSFLSSSAVFWCLLVLWPSTSSAFFWRLLLSSFLLLSSACFSRLKLNINLIYQLYGILCVRLGAELNSSRAKPFTGWTVHKQFGGNSGWLPNGRRCNCRLWPVNHRTVWFAKDRKMAISSNAVCRATFSLSVDSAM